MLISFFIQICLENRYKNDQGNDCLLSVDCCDFRIEEPYPFELEWSKNWFSHKFDGPGLRYKIALCILTGDVCWINGPFPCGQKNDWTIFKSELLNYLDANERVEADDGYSAGDPEFVKTPSGIHHPEEFKDCRRRVMGRQETINARNKNWGALSKVFRHDMLKHQLVFRAVSVLVQISLNNDNPLYDTSEYTDHH